MSEKRNSNLAQSWLSCCSCCPWPTSRAMSHWEGIEWCRLSFSPAGGYYESRRVFAKEWLATIYAPAATVEGWTRGVEVVAVHGGY